MRRFVLCADDFALSDPVSGAIVDLVDKERLGAVSCLVTSVHWRTHAAELRHRGKRVDVGLHLNLIADEMLHHDPGYRSALGSYPTLPALILRSQLRLLDRQQIAVEIEHQLDRFVDEFGALPDFVDGHRHVHQLPVVRDALLDVYRKRLADRSCYVRNVRRVIHSRSAQFKARVVAALGAGRLEADLLAERIPHNRRFGGIYDFSPDADFSGLMRAWLSQVEDSDLIMCHPARDDTTAADPIGAARSREYAYLKSDTFTVDCERASVRPGRFRDRSGVGTSVFARNDRHD